MIKQTIKKYIFLILAVVFALTLAVSVYGWDTLTMPERYSLTTTARSGFGVANQIIIIDQGKTAIELLDGNGVLKTRLKGENADTFYYAEQAAQSEDGRIYIADRAYIEDGDLIKTLERVLELQDGKYRTVWQTELTDSDSRSEHGSSIFELQIYDGAVYFLRAEDYGLGLYRFEPEGQASLVRRAFSGESINDASIDLSTGTITMVTRRGYVRALYEDDKLWKTMESDAEHLMPQSVSARNGVVWFSDVYANRVCRLSEDALEDGFETVYISDTGVIDVQASADGSELLASDGAGFYRIGASGQYTSEVVFARFWQTVLLRICFGITSAIGVALMLHLLRQLMRLLRNESAMRIVLVVLASASVSIFVAYSLMSDLFSQEDNTLVESMKLYAEASLQHVNPDDVFELDSERDYSTSAFSRVREPMDSMIRLAHAEENYYSYALFRIDGDTLRYIMNSDDSVMCGQPYSMADEEYIAEVQRTGKAVALKTQDADGNRVSVIIPVINNSGDIVAALEMGVDLSLRNRSRTQSLVNMILNVLCATAVVVMLILEIIFLISFHEKRRILSDGGTNKLDGPTTVPVRTLMFLIYAADGMQEAFIAVLCTQLYKGGLPFSDGTAAALPLSVEVFAMAASSAISGQAVQRHGSRRIFLLGLLTQIAGFLICPIMGSYLGIFIGKALIGLGMGAVYVTCNTVASSSDSEENSAEAFAGVAAGTISGIAAGAGLSSVFLSIGGWKLAYLVSALFVYAGVMLVTASGDVLPEKREESAQDVQDISTAKFILNRRVPTFFLLILVPFMMTPSYRVYFFPMFAQEQGISDARVGQILMLCGLIVLYLGPKVSSVVLKKLGSFRGVLAASLLAAGGIAVFVLFPTTGSIVFGVVLVYMAYAFGSVCQYSYFQHLPECLAYGNGRSMSAFSVFENLGCTIGPMTFGSLLALGYRAGIAVFSIGLAVLTAVFAAVTWRAGRHYD